MTILPNIITKQLILRLPKSTEAKLMRDFVIKNKQHFLPWEAIQIDDYYTENYWLERIEQINKDFLSDKSCCLNIYKKEEDEKLIGMVNYTNFIRGAFHSCFLGFKIAKEFENKGYMTLALKASIERPLQII